MADPDPFASTIASAGSVEGILEIDRVAGGKDFQGTWLLRDDGGDYVLSYRPDASLFKFVGKRVFAIGQPYRPGRDEQHINAQHFKLLTMVLAPGEAAWDPEPTALPPAPRVTTAAGLAAMARRWVEAEGTLTSEWTLEDGGYWGNARLRLDNGHVSVSVSKSAWDTEWAPLVGTDVLVTARVTLTDEDKLILGGANAITTLG